MASELKQSKRGGDYGKIIHITRFPLHTHTRLKILSVQLAKSMDDICREAIVGDVNRRWEEMKKKEAVLEEAGAGAETETETECSSAPFSLDASSGNADTGTD